MTKMTLFQPLDDVVSHQTKQAQHFQGLTLPTPGAFVLVPLRVRRPVAVVFYPPMAPHQGEKLQGSQVIPQEVTQEESLFDDLRGCIDELRLPRTTTLLLPSPAAADFRHHKQDLTQVTPLSRFGGPPLQLGGAKQFITFLPSITGFPRCGPFGISLLSGQKNSLCFGEKGGLIVLEAYHVAIPVLREKGSIFQRGHTRIECDDRFGQKSSTVKLFQEGEERGEEAHVVLCRRGDLLVDGGFEPGRGEHRSQDAQVVANPARTCVMGFLAVGVELPGTVVKSFVVDGDDVTGKAFRLQGLGAKEKANKDVQTLSKILGAQTSKQEVQGRVGDADAETRSEVGHISQTSIGSQHPGEAKAEHGKKRVTLASRLTGIFQRRKIRQNGMVPSSENPAHCLFGSWGYDRQLFSS